MSDIFISYKREDRAAAEKLAVALEHHGRSVWWDPQLRAGQRYDDVIGDALARAKCVIVLWSKQSVDSLYVRDEATYALNAEKLLPVAIEEVETPFRFASIETGQLQNWDGSPVAPELLKLVDDITFKLGSVSPGGMPNRRAEGGAGTLPAQNSTKTADTEIPSGGLTGKPTGKRTKLLWLSSLLALLALLFFYFAAIKNACSRHDALAVSAIVGFAFSVFLIFQKRSYRFVWVVAPLVGFVTGMPFGHNYGTITKTALFGLEQGTNCQANPAVLVILGIVMVLAIIDQIIFLRSR